MCVSARDYSRTPAAVATCLSGGDPTGVYREVRPLV